MWRDPNYYVLQGLGSIWDALVVHVPWTEQRILSDLLPRVVAAPAALTNAATNLAAATSPYASPVQAFGTIALESLGWNSTSKVASVGAAVVKAVMAGTNT